MRKFSLIRQCASVFSLIITARGNFLAISHCKMSNFGIVVG
jgi:hypothetical protein